MDPDAVRSSVSARSTTPDAASRPLDGTRHAAGHDRAVHCGLRGAGSTPAVAVRRRAARAPAGPRPLASPRGDDRDAPRAVTQRWRAARHRRPRLGTTVAAAGLDRRAGDGWPRPGDARPGRAGDPTGTTLRQVDAAEPIATTCIQVARCPDLRASGLAAHCAGDTLQLDAVVPGDHDEHYALMSDPRQLDAPAFGAAHLAGAHEGSDRTLRRPLDARRARLLDGPAPR